jgi:hypothetical protein
MKLLKLFSALFLTIHLSGCGEYFSSEVYVTGKVGEVVVVCDDAIWNSSFRSDLDSNLTRFIMPYFPDVATFEPIHYTKSNFVGAAKRHRNVLFLKIDPNHKGDKGKIQYRKGVWATNQLVIEVLAKDYQQLVETFNSGADEIHSKFEYEEWNRIRKHFGSKQNQAIDKQLKQNFSIHLDLPNASKIVSSRKNFYRIELPLASRPIEFVGESKQDLGAVFSGVMVYQYPYTDSSQFAIDRLLRARDTMLRYNVPHETPGLYMGTQYNDFVYPEYSESTNFSKSINGIEVRGMFEFKGRYRHSTGGAFWSFHFIHPKTEKIVCVSGYVDAPSTTSWTHAIREIQAIWKSVTIV